MSNAKITIYPTPYCPYCHAAKALLNRKGAAFEEIDVQDPALRQQMMERTGGNIPAIGFNGALRWGMSYYYQMNAMSQSRGY